MGVYGLWRLLDATGKQVPLETLEGKVLAIDVSIWIHQVLQGYQDRLGNPKPNAHLIGLFNRICKLLYYKIKPVFVFDGGVPMLKKDTIALRRKQKSMARNKAQQMRTELIQNWIKHSTVKKVLNPGEENVASGSSEVIINLQTKRTADDMFKLPDMPSTSKVESNLSDDYNSDSSDDVPSPRKQTKWNGNIHCVDVSTAEFKSLPADVRYDILTDLKETRKQNSWGRLHEMPEETHEFSGFQMRRLLKRRLVQQSLESAEKEMGGKTLTLEELDKLLKEQGINTNQIENYTRRIAADNITRLLYISDKNALKRNDDSNNENTQDENKIDECIAGPSKPTPISEDINEYELNDWDSDVEMIDVNDFEFTRETSSDAESEESTRLPLRKYTGRDIMKNPALTYMLEYSGLTETQIHNLLEQKKKETAESISKAPRQESVKTQNYKDRKIKELTPPREVDEECIDLESIDVESTLLSNAESKIDTPPIEIANTSNEVQIDPQSKDEKGQTEDAGSQSEAIRGQIQDVRSQTEDKRVISSTDSDSEDFVEVEDVPIPKAVINKFIPHSIQIMFKSDEKVEDDLFADMFESPNNELSIETNSQTTLSSNQSSKLSKTDCDRKIFGNEIILEKELSKDKEKNKQSFDIKQNDINVQPTIEINLNDTRKSVKLKEIEIKNNGIKETENSIEHTIDSAKENVEIASIEDKTSGNASVGDAKKINSVPMNEDELQALESQLEDRQMELMENLGKLERQGINISNKIQIEAQELLRLFGIPYIVAPMEAEAQCAYLEQIRLTDGTITDDSDIWLFGGQCVYKNFFDNNKKVLEFRSCDIQHHLKLTRNEMIRLALLVGSDYTTGLTGIGPVTALEILAAFPSESDDLLHGLMKFCSWIQSGRSTGPGRTTLRNKLQNLQIQRGFPSQAVVQAYLFPEVDESRETFSWGKINSVLLTDYAKQKFGWNRERSTEIITPVLKRLEDKQSQSKISAYFKLHTAPKSIEMALSKRVQKAVERLNNNNVEEDPTPSETVKPAKKIKSSGESRKRKRESKKEQEQLKNKQNDDTKPKVLNASALNEKNVEEFIPQREKDKVNALKKKLHAIEVLRKSNKGLYKTKKVKRCVRKVKEKAELSESDSS